MSLVVLEDAHAVLNIREDLLPHFKMGETFRADVPALSQKGVVFRINYISPLGSYATWRSTKQTGSYQTCVLSSCTHYPNHSWRDCVPACRYW